MERPHTQSESLKRFHEEQSERAVNPEGATKRRLELEAQMAEFHARGGEVQEVPSTLMANKTFTWRDTAYQANRR